MHFDVISCVWCVNALLFVSSLAHVHCVGRECFMLYAMCFVMSAFNVVTFVSVSSSMC